MNKINHYDISNKKNYLIAKILPTIEKTLDYMDKKYFSKLSLYFKDIDNTAFSWIGKDIFDSEGYYSVYEYLNHI